MNLYLIRHGETEWNAMRRYQGQVNVPLTEAGLAQARLLTEKFPAEHLDAVYSSTLDRAWFTAQPLAARYACPLTAEPDLRELNFGVLEGLTFEEISAQYPEQASQLFSRPDLLRIPDGETFMQLEQRATQLLQRVYRQHKDDTIALVAHGAINKTLLASLMHIPLRYLWSIGQSNTAVNLLVLTDDFYTVEYLNNTSHLGAAHVGSV